MIIRKRIPFVLFSATLIASSSAIVSCEKASFSTSTKVPDPSAPDVVTFSYSKQPLKLFVSAEITVRMTGEVRGKVQFEGDGEAQINPHDDEHLLVKSAMSKLRKFQAEGEKLLNGKTSEQMRQELLANNKIHEVITDLSGRDDPEANKAYKQQSGDKKGQVGAEEVSQNSIAAGPFFQPPELPRVPLKIGEKQKLKRQSSKWELAPGFEMPLETDYKYVLEKVDESTGSRLATIKIESSTTGMLSDPMAFLQLFSETEGTLIYDLDRQVPVSYSGVDNRDFGFGDPARGTPKRMNQYVTAKYTYTAYPEEGTVEASVATAPPASQPETQPETSAQPATTTVAPAPAPATPPTTPNPGAGAAGNATVAPATAAPAPAPAPAVAPAAKPSGAANPQ